MLRSIFLHALVSVMLIFPVLGTQPPAQNHHEPFRESIEHAQGSKESCQHRRIDPGRFAALQDVKLPTPTVTSTMSGYSLPVSSTLERPLSTPPIATHLLRTTSPTPSSVRDIPESPALYQNADGQQVVLEDAFRANEEL
ncbi:hypothetical protein EVG20_g1920 [Dentipellis fragilis]|uniref:Uncharacterized protein n=1 Tax=Dentipellis fragilis TaxID=205917 RepID=A0A4Y9ZBC9_9AGAM|nr:hypothetical protein EVG20_g1920 [Dentipellis fragilis]